VEEKKELYRLVKTWIYLQLYTQINYRRVHKYVDVHMDCK
jgi:hypothetical protein